MAAHGTLAEFVKIQRAWAMGSGPLHYGEPCPRCAARTGMQTELPGLHIEATPTERKS
jgi:hypothetical protein